MTGGRTVRSTALVVVMLLVVGGCRWPGTSGPARFRATGSFRTELRAGRWWLVTPDGRPFYSHGVNHVRSSPNTDRLTGRCPYCEAVAAKYPDVGAWTEATVERLRGWGFNTIGAWSDLDVLAPRMPYTEILGMASGADWFAPEFEDHARAVVAAEVVPRRDDPNLVGWFLDNELRWGRDFRADRTMLDDYLALPVGSPGRSVAEGYVGDPDGFLFALATRYYRVSTEAIRAEDPHHLVLGSRLISFLTPEPVVAAAGPWLDVLSVNHYDVIDGLIGALDGVWGPFVPVDASLSRFHELSGLPILVTEYSFRGADSGLPNSYPPIYLTAPSQAGRADLWQTKTTALYASPWIVGDHWFEWADQPPGGRRGDGEDNNFGLVSNEDDAYGPLVDRMAAMHAIAPGASGARACRSWAASGGPRPRCVDR